MSESGRPRLVLASASPRRLDLLRQIGIEPDAVIAAEVDETAASGERPRDLARRLAEMKARTVAEAEAGAFVLGADTVVACGRRILGKPAGEAEARRFLGLLSGRRHRVFGGVCLVTPTGAVRTRIVQTVVTFKRLTRAETNGYIASGEWQGKAGAYAIQGRAARFVTQVNGSYPNVVGLPVCETAMLLDGNGFPLDTPA